MIFSINSSSFFLTENELEFVEMSLFFFDVHSGDTNKTSN
jgi:hypothetical protein